MKYVIFSLAEASKLEFAGIEKLGKNDHVVCVHVKGKKTISAALKETLDTVKATIDYVDVESASDVWMNIAYLIGFHTGAKHDTILVTKDKSKLPAKVLKGAKCYVSFKSCATSTSTSSAAKPGSGKKKDKDELSQALNAFTSGNATEGLAHLAQSFLK